VAGAPPERFQVTNHLKAGPRGRMLAVASGGQTAETDFRTLAWGEGFALVEARPHTGRTHQIRVHLAGAGYPLLGDTLYGGPASLPLHGREVKIGRYLLHAYRLTFRHPEEDRHLTLEAPIPGDFAPLTEKPVRVVPIGPKESPENRS
jgi:23S rRNA pseudouridine1911/1915/1917 synthase